MTPADRAFRIPITVGPLSSGPASDRCGEPVTLGLPFPRGMVASANSLHLCDADGRHIGAQFDLVERWPDGSARWMLIDFQATRARSTDARYELRVGATADPAPRLGRVSHADEVVVDTGAAMFRCRAGGGFPFDEVSVESQSIVDVSRSGLIIDDSVGRRLSVGITRVTLERNGPLRAVVRCDAYAGDPRRPTLAIVMRLHFFAGSSAVRVAITLRNPRRASHPGGYWSLGQRSSAYLRRAALRLAMAVSSGDNPRATVRSSSEPGAPFAECSPPFELYQDSSGGTNWNSPVHVNRHGVVPASFCGYRLRATGQERHGLRACPAVVLERGSHQMALAMAQFWQNCPKAIEADDSTIELGLFPAQYADSHELQGGEQKTHAFVIAFGPDAISGGTFDWCRAPLVARATPGWYASAEAVPFLTPAAGDPHDEYLRLVGSAIAGVDTQMQKREAIDEYGWRNFGELWADHEAVFSKGPAPLVSHYNNQYDGIGGFACQFLRTGDMRWWELMDDLAHHVVDIDVYHTDEDRAAYNHGLFWHTCHYTDAGTSTHRSYPPSPGVTGGGPGAEHDYSSGLVLHYFLTGDPLSRETVLELASWVLAMDDGRRSGLRRWLDRGPTGLASATVSPRFHGPGRGVAYSINTLLDAHRLTGDETFLRKAHELVRRSVHPADDVDALSLLDAERRWSYTVFLQVLSRYLDYLGGCGELGEMYAYARESLLRYVRWMADNERPYLERAETLEYPTETWAAQDLRKAEVFAHAARHATGRERERFLERSSGFFRYAISTLGEFVTHTLTRPQVLLMNYGYMHAYVVTHPEAAAPAPVVSHWSPPARIAFVPQRERILRRAIVVATAASLTLLAAGAAIGWTVLH
jgi:hypothetical protein